MKTSVSVVDGESKSINDESVIFIYLAKVRRARISNYKDNTHLI